MLSLCGQSSSMEHRGMPKPSFCVLWEMSVLCLLPAHPVYAHSCDELPVLQVEVATLEGWKEAMEGCQSPVLQTVYT